MSAQIGPVAIRSLADLERAVRDRQLIADAIARVVGFFAGFKAAAHKLHKAICDRESEILAPLRALDAARRDAIGAFKAAQDRERAERERILADEQRRAREADAAAEAAALERDGEHDLAAAVVAEAITAPAPIVALPDPTRGIEGLAFTRRYHWRFEGGPAEVKDTPPHVLARALALIPREFLMVDDKKLGAYARAMKGSATVPGIEFYDTADPVRR